MTAQVPDTILVNADEYILAGVNGGGLFDPLDHGMRPVMATTACWRGFECRYRVRDDRLLLDALQVNLDEPAPTVLGVTPETPPDSSDYSAIYRDMAAPIGFTGGLLAARDFIEELYVHMGFHPAWKYREVRELLVEGGVVTANRDCSEQISETRQRLSEHPLEPGPGAQRDEIMAWVQATFSRDYGW